MTDNETSNREDDGYTSSYQYKIWEAEKVVETIKLWRRQYTDYVAVGTSQHKYGLPISTATEGDDNTNDCPYDEGIHGCYNYFLTIQDKITHPPESESASILPEVLWISGLHHEDHGLGTTILMETVSLMLEAASCEAKPRIRKRKGHFRHNNNSEEVQEAYNCRAKLLRRGINQQQRQWIARLVSTRRIVVVPIADPIRFYRQQQQQQQQHMNLVSLGSLYDDSDDDIDPEIDFASSSKIIKAGNQCMQSITAQTIDELFCDHMFQIMLSFHSSSDGERGQQREHRRSDGGDKIGYPWSTDDTVGMPTPDNQAQSDIAKTLLKSASGSKFDGSGSNSGGSDMEDYQFGPINEIFQDRIGSMEDWSYAASWWDDYDDTSEAADESSQTTSATTRHYCQHDVKNAYIHTRKRRNDSNNKPYNRNATNRAISMRIVIDDKSQQNHLGSVLDIFNMNDDGNQNYDNSSAGEFVFNNNTGLVARHIRVALESAEMVQPYVTISAIENMTFSDDIIPQTPLLSEKEYCQKSKSAAVFPLSSRGEKESKEAGTTSSTKIISIKWSVGGSIEVAETDLWYANLLDVSDDDYDYIWDCTIQPDTIPRGFQRAGGNVTTGYHRRDNTGWHQTSRTNNFETQIDISDFSAGEQLVVIASATVDQNWRNFNDDGKNDDNDDSSKGQEVRPFPPQSHLVNARTNPLWHYTNVGKKITGRLVYFSAPVTIVVANNYDLAEGGVIELSSRLVTSPLSSSPIRTDRAVASTEDNSSPVTSAAVDVVLLAAFGLLVSFVFLVVIKMIRLRKKILKESKTTEREMSSADGEYAFKTDERGYYYDESCPVHVCNDSYVEDYCYDDDRDGNWEIIDFTIN